MSGKLKYALHSLALALLFTFLAATTSSQSASATNAESQKTASGVFSASGQTLLAFSACNPGQPLGISGDVTTTRTCAFSYGKEADQLSRLNYYGYRYYDPLSLQWTQADPLFRIVPDIAYDSPRLMSLYTFSLNNPVRYLDPDGRMPLALPAIAAAPALAPGALATASAIATWGIGLLGSAVTAVAIASRDTGPYNFDKIGGGKASTWIPASHRPRRETLGDALQAMQAENASENANASDSTETGPNGGARPEEHQAIVNDRKDARSKKREAKSRKANGQNQSGKGRRGKKEKGSAGERGRDRRRRKGNPLKKRIDEGQHKGDGAGNEHQRDNGPRGPTR